MRMWMVNPKFLSNKRLLGEHGEIHKFRHSFVKKHKMSGRFSPIVQIEPLRMQERHDEIVKEMLSRGMNHNSPYEQPDVSYLWRYLDLKVDLEYNLRDLADRCPESKKRIAEFS